MDRFHIDILTAHFVRHPNWFDVIVASNLFGDILRVLGPACTGTIGIAPSANLNPERTFPSLFEGASWLCADIYGKGIANPIGHLLGLARRRWSTSVTRTRRRQSCARIPSLAPAEGPTTPTWAAAYDGRGLQAAASAL